MAAAEDAERRGVSAHLSRALVITQLSSAVGGRSRTLNILSVHGLSREGMLLQHTNSCSHPSG